MELIKADSIPKVWLDACAYLRSRKGREDYDVILHVTDPIPLSLPDRAVIENVDAFMADHHGPSLNTVAETIFPLQDYLRDGVSGVFERYPERMKRIHAARKDKQWGCYAVRILRQTDRDGSIYNPLEHLLKKLTDHSEFKAVYELGLGHALNDYEPAGGDIGIYDGAHDRRPFRGHLPCLSHVSVKVDNGAVRLNATYRSHYYMQRLLGNLMGLARLQFFLAREAKLTVGPLTINSTFAKLDTGDGKWGMGDIDALLASCRNAYEAQEAA